MRVDDVLSEFFSRHSDDEMRCISLLVDLVAWSQVKEIALHDACCDASRREFGQEFYDIKQLGLLIMIDASAFRSELDNEEGEKEEEEEERPSHAVRVLHAAQFDAIVARFYPDLQGESHMEICTTVIAELMAHVGEMERFAHMLYACQDKYFLELSGGKMHSISPDQFYTRAELMEFLGAEKEAENYLAFTDFMNAYGYDVNDSERLISGADLCAYIRNSPKIYPHEEGDEG